MPARYKKRPDGRYLIQILIGRYENGKPRYKNIYATTVKELEERAAAFKQDLNLHHRKRVKRHKRRGFIISGRQYLYPHAGGGAIAKRIGGIGDYCF